jgi:predicted transcriptional regulator
LRKICRKIDRKENVSATQIINFTDPKEFLSVLTLDSYAIVQQVRKSPRTYRDLMETIHKDRSTVVRAVKKLAAIGLVEIINTINTGHGKHKMVVTKETGELLLQARI